MKFYATVLILYLFYDIGSFQLNFMNFYDFMPSGTPANRRDGIVVREFIRAY